MSTGIFDFAADRPAIVILRQPRDHTHVNDHAKIQYNNFRDMAIGKFNYNLYNVLKY